MVANRLFRLVRPFSRRSLMKEDDNNEEMSVEDVPDLPPKTIYIPCRKPSKKPKLVRASSLSAGVFIKEEDDNIHREQRRASYNVSDNYMQKPTSVKCRKFSWDGGVPLVEKISSKSSNNTRIQQVVLHHRPFLAILLLVTLALAAGTLGDDETAPTRGKERGTPLPAFASKKEGIAQDMYQAYKQLEEEYHAKAFRPDNEHKWRVVNEKDGAKVSLLEHESDPTCPYVRMETLIPTSVASCWEFLKIENWGWSMPKMDPFYDTHSVHANYTHQGVNMILVQKKTHRILAFGKRDFVFLSVTDLPLEDGTWVSGSVSVQTPDVPRSPSYTRAFQDSIAFYKPIQDKNGQEQCHLTIVCRIDLNDSGESGSGGWIPMWLYVKTIGATGIKSVLKMKDALLEMQQEQKAMQQEAYAPAPAKDTVASAPTASQLMSRAKPPTPAPILSSSIFTSKILQGETDNQQQQETDKSPQSEESSSTWWSRPRGGAFGGGLLSFRPPPKPTTAEQVADRWKPLYQVFTHYSPKPTTQLVAIKNTWGTHQKEMNDENSKPSLPNWFRRLPMIGDRFGGSGSSR
ncbi:expressed unknown protein [Seminavis robusta]|uniref:START domain-containing protein n=1 Tax=Seminavis robusta TaxID=568900 RepID=A0A9N8ED73_9STRA|nr:expressed unknown protein [Seminavis robusta]|eukprot:Sro951_g223910.1 n/a (573) ;mRNA; r:24323-26139